MRQSHSTQFADITAGASLSKRKHTGTQCPCCEDQQQSSRKKHRADLRKKQRQEGVPVMLKQTTDAQVLLITTMFFERLKKQLRLRHRKASITGDLFPHDAFITFSAWGVPAVYRKNSVPLKFGNILAPTTIEKLQQDYQVCWLSAGIVFSSGSRIQPDTGTLCLSYSRTTCRLSLAIAYHVFNQGGREQTAIDTEQ